MPEYPEIICHTSCATWTQDEQPLSPDNICKFCDRVVRGEYVEVMRTYWRLDKMASAGPRQVHFNLHPHCAKVCGFKTRYNY